MPATRHDSEARTRIVLALLTGTPPEALAREHAVDPAELARWKAEFLASVAPRAASSTPARWAVAAALGLVCFSAGAALSQSTGFPIVLTTFSANTPAVASEVNNNFKALKDAADALKTSTDTLRTNAEAKLGALSSTNLTVPGTSTLTGAVSAGSTMTVAGATTLRGTVSTGQLTATGATSLVGNTTVTGNLAVTGDLTNQRYVAQIGWDSRFAAVNTTSSYVELDNTRVRALCADGDGCLVRVIMRDFSGTHSDASTVPSHLEIDAVDGTFRVSDDFGNSFIRANGNAQRDGDTVSTIVLKSWNCHLADTAWTPGQGQAATEDGRAGLWLMNFNTDPAYQSTCQVIFDD
jgi:hypothetical protein